MFFWDTLYNSQFQTWIITNYVEAMFQFNRETVENLHAALWFTQNSIHNMEQNLEDFLIGPLSLVTVSFTLVSSLMIDVSLSFLDFLIPVVESDNSELFSYIESW